MVQCYTEVMEKMMDVGTQTDPVVVLSLAQAAVLGLISQNEIFGATIAPNGFCNVEARDCPPPAEAMEYDYADQLIGANGDYLAEPNKVNRKSEGSYGEEKKSLGAQEKTKASMNENNQRVDKTEKSLEEQTCVKGEKVEFSTNCFYSTYKNSESTALDLAPQRVPLKEEQNKDHVTNTLQNNNNLETTSHDINTTQERVVVQTNDGCTKEEAHEEDIVLNLKTPQEFVSHSIRQCYESSVLSYEAPELDLAPADYEDSSQASTWADGENPSARRVQIDRLDVNVQIDESYCVDVGEGLKRWKCRMCEKSYTSKYNLVTHILGHSGVKPHECMHCGKLFKQPSHLQTHLLTHQGTRPHKCTVCKKAFTQTSHLKRHMLQHSDIKPYSCRFCGRGFAYPSELRTHETKHENGRCHVCTQCSMEFPTYAHLRRHLVTHQGPASFQCTECHKSFSYRSQLQNHLMKHQNARPHICSECGLEFVQVHHLKQHMLIHKVLTQQTFKHKVLLNLVPFC